jgi:hypothetical protein
VKTPTHHLFDVDPIAITICKKGANGQRIFLRKSTDDELVVLPAEHTILKSEDWSVFYCVVAEPGSVEDCGQGDGAGSGILDVWKSEDEIRRAAHRLLKNKGYVNAMHDALEAEGCAIVENAVALADFWVGEQVIKKGSWYVAIEPSPEFREKVDSGEITGVSLEGTGYREAIKKAKADKTPDVKVPNKPGKTNWVEQRGGLPRPIREVAEDLFGKDPARLASSATVSATIRLAVGIAHNFAEGHDGKGNKVSAKTQAKFEKAIAQWNKMRAQSSVKKIMELPAPAEDELAREGDRLRKQMAEGGILFKIAQKLGIESDELAEVELKKDLQTFAPAMAARELDEELPAAFDTLRSVIWRAFYPYGEDKPDDPKAHVAQSLEEFTAWAHDLLDRVYANGDGNAKQAVAKALGIDPDRLPDEAGTLEDEVDNDTAQKLAKAVEDNSTAVNKLIDLIGEGKLVTRQPKSDTTESDDASKKDVKKSDDADADAPITKADLAKAMDELLVEIATGVSVQPEDDGEQKVAKSDNALKGLFD